MEWQKRYVERNLGSGFGVTDAGLGTSLGASIAHDRHDNGYATTCATAW